MTTTQLLTQAGFTTKDGKQFVKSMKGIATGSSSEQDFIDSLQKLEDKGKIEFWFSNPNMIVNLLQD